MVRKGDGEGEEGRGRERGKGSGRGRESERDKERERIYSSIADFVASVKLNKIRLCQLKIKTNKKK